jgi:hypothetical protein
MLSSITSFAQTSVEISFPLGASSSPVPEYSRMTWSAFPYSRFSGQMRVSVRTIPI